MGGMGGYGQAAGDLFSSVSDLFTSGRRRSAMDARAAGFKGEAEGFRKAQHLEEENAHYEKVSGVIKGAQIQRQTYKALGGIEADAAGAGFAMSGSIGDILRDSAYQGHMATSLNEVQTTINSNSYLIAAEGYRMQAEASDRAAEAAKSHGDGTLGIIGTVVQIGATIVGAVYGGPAGAAAGSAAGGAFKKGLQAVGNEDA